MGCHEAVHEAIEVGDHRFDVGVTGRGSSGRGHVSTSVTPYYQV